MKKVALVLILASLMVGLAQAQTPQVRLVWEKTFPSTLVLAMDAADTINGPSFLGGQGNTHVVMDRNGNVATIPIPRDPIYPFLEIHLSPKGRYVLNASFSSSVYVRTYPDLNRCLYKPSKIEVRDLAGQLVFERNDFWGELISDNGTIFARSRDSLMFFGLDGRLKGKAVFAPERVINCSPAILSADGSRALVYTATMSPPMKGIVVAVDSTGRRLFEVSNPEINYALRSDGAALISQQPRNREKKKGPYDKKAMFVKDKKVMFYDRDGALQATWTLPYMGPSFNQNPMAFSEDGNYVAVYSSEEIALLQICAPRFGGR